MYYFFSHFLLSCFHAALYLIKRMTPKMFWMQGRKTPMMVPRLACPGGGGFWVEITTGSASGLIIYTTQL